MICDPFKAGLFLAGSGGLFFCRRLRFHSRMVPEFDIYRSANLLVKRHGQDAPVHAAMRADAMLEGGDLDGLAVWKPILRVIEELQRTGPKSGEAVH